MLAVCTGQVFVLAVSVLAGSEVAHQGSNSCMVSCTLPLPAASPPPSSTNQQGFTAVCSTLRLPEAAYCGMLSLHVGNNAMLIRNRFRRNGCIHPGRLLLSNWHCLHVLLQMLHNTFNT